MNYTIYQHSDNIEVFLEEKEYLRVVRKFTWSGILHSEFIMDGRTILTTSYDNSFFRKRLAIIFQDLPQPVYLEKRDGSYAWIVEDRSITMTRQVLKNPVEQLFVDGRPTAEVETVFVVRIGGPTLYRLRVVDGCPDELNILLFFLMNLAPTPA